MTCAPRSRPQGARQGPLRQAAPWEDLPNRRACRLADYTAGDVTDGDAFEQYIDWFFDTGTRLRAAIDAAVATGHPARVAVGARHRRPNPIIHLTPSAKPLSSLRTELASWARHMSDGWTESCARVRLTAPRRRNRAGLPVA